MKRATDWYRPGMTAEETERFMARIEREERAYKAMDAADAEAMAGPEDYDCEDPVRDGWVGKDGRP